MTCPRFFGLALLFVLVALSPSLQAAAPPNDQERLAKAKKLYQQLEYEDVISLLHPLIDGQTAKQKEKEEAYELLALSYFILGDNEAATDAFARLLNINPKHELNDPSGSPKLKDFFESVKKSVIKTKATTKHSSTAQPPTPPAPLKETPITFEHQAPQNVTSEKVITITARLLGDRKGRAQSIILHWRKTGADLFQTEEMSYAHRRGTVRISLPPSDNDYMVEYFFEARDWQNQVIAESGSIITPLAFPVTGQGNEVRPFYKSWWFWTAVGVVAIAGTTAGVLAATANRAPDGNLGTLDLPLR